MSHPIRLDDARAQMQALEDAVAEARRLYGSANPQVLAAYLRPILEELAAVRQRIDEAIGLEMVTSGAASLWLRLQGGAVGEGRAPLAIVSRVLDAFQVGVRQLAAFVEMGRAAVYQVPKDIRAEASLDMVALAPGSARIAVAPTQPQLHIERPLPLAELALQQLVRAAVWAEENQEDPILETLFTDRTVRRQVASRLREIAPSTLGDYQALELTGPIVSGVGVGNRVVVTPRAFEHVSEYLRRRAREPTILQGRLVAIDVEKDVFELRHGPKRIHCRFGPGLLEQAKALLESFVEVAGIGHFQLDSETPERIDVDRIRPLTPREQASLTPS